MEAKNYIAKANGAKANNPEASVNAGMIALAEGDVETAQAYIAKGTGADNYSEALGNLNIAQGNYAQAANYLRGVKTNSAALAQILSKDYDSAAKTLAGVSNADATTSYLKAVLAARTGSKQDVISNLKDAVAKDATYSSYAAKDLEFAKYAADSAFKSIAK